MDIPDRVQQLMAAGADVAVRAPGRANLIGEHTDYNDGFVLPIAIDLATYVVGTRAGQVVLLSDARDAAVTVSLSEPEMPASDWGRYVAGVVSALRDDDVPTAGIHGSIVSDVPMGAGLASSAALEVAVACALSIEEIDPVHLAVICRRAENEYVGVQSGIMDQLTAAAARAEHACFIDCRDNAIEYVSFPDDLCVLIIDSGVRRELRSTGYNERVSECTAAAQAFGVETLRELTIVDIDNASGIDPLLVGRARHVVSENERVLATVAAFGTRDRGALTEIFEASHASYSSDFDASTPEIDELVARSRATPGVVAARLTGGGWGGCIANLVEREADVSSIADAVAGVRWWATDAVAGASSLL